jgi:hypothetical protein
MPRHDQPNTHERAARILAQNAPEQAKLVAQVYGTDAHIKRLSPNDELWTWMYQDDTVDVPSLMLQGVPVIDIALKKFPLRRRLVEQNGLTWKEQKAYCKRMAARAEKALETGVLPTQPVRPKGV